jgi:hypothetical protein
MRSHWLDEWENEQEKQDEEFNERAAIMQYEAGMNKSIAELKAMELLKAKYPDLVKIDFKE